MSKVIRMRRASLQPRRDRRTALHASVLVVVALAAAWTLVGLLYRALVVLTGGC